MHSASHPLIRSLPHAAHRVPRFVYSLLAATGDCACQRRRVSKDLIHMPLIASAGDAKYSKHRLSFQFLTIQLSNAPAESTFDIKHT